MLPSNPSVTVALESASNEHFQETQKSIPELREEVTRTIRRYVYVGQGLLIAIIALIWVASYFVVLKSPYVTAPNQTHPDQIAKVPINQSVMGAMVDPPKVSGSVKSEIGWIPKSKTTKTERKSRINDSKANALPNNSANRVNNDNFNIDEGNNDV